MHAAFSSRGLRIVGIGLDRDESVGRQFLGQMKPSFEIAHDPAAETAAVLGIKSMPTSYVVSPDGRILLEHRGFRAEDAEFLERKFSDWLK